MPLPAIFAALAAKLGMGAAAGAGAASTAAAPAIGGGMAASGLAAAKAAPAAAAAKGASAAGAAGAGSSAIPAWIPHALDIAGALSGDSRVSKLGGALGGIRSGQLGYRKTGELEAGFNQAEGGGG